MIEIKIFYLQLLSLAVIMYSQLDFLLLLLWGSPRRASIASSASTPSLPLIRAARRVVGRKEPGGPRFCLWRPLRPRAVRVDVPGSAAGRARAP